MDKDKREALEVLAGKDQADAIIAEMDKINAKGEDPKEVFKGVEDPLDRLSALAEQLEEAEVADQIRDAVKALREAAKKEPEAKKGTEEPEAKKEKPVVKAEAKEDEEEETPSDDALLLALKGLQETVTSLQKEVAELKNADAPRYIFALPATASQKGEGEPSAPEAPTFPKIVQEMGARMLPSE